MYEAADVLTDLCILDLYTLTDIREVKTHDLENRIIKAAF